MLILICGLGNPGTEYLNTRHNIGFKVIDALAYTLKINSFESKFSSLIAIYKNGEHKVILCKPQTFMNLSGQAISKIVNFYKIPVENIWVVHDDIDLEFTTIKVKQGGSHAGHNGLKNIDNHIGKNYHRIRVGVGRPLNKEDVTNYVLSNFSKTEMKELDFVIQNTIEQLSSHNVFTKPF